MTASTTSELAYLRTPRAVRERAFALYALGLQGRLEHFAIDEAKLPRVAERVVAVARSAYPDVRAIPYHSRWRHFGAGGTDRIAELDGALASKTAEERLFSKLELAITSVLLDAGAGGIWSYRDANGNVFSRSEGLAVASFELFARGDLSDKKTKDPWRADPASLSRCEASEVARAFQVDDATNPMPGLDGRAALLRAIGDVVRRKTEYFGSSAPRLGAIGLHLASRAHASAIAASTVFGVVLDALSDIWPGRGSLDGQNLGDVWPHPAVGRVPLHKLSQWLTYSLFEPLEEYGLVVTDIDALTGLAEYRNGGLFIDGGVLAHKHPEAAFEKHLVSSTLVVEWRGLTVALLDRTATEVRRLLGLSKEELPLAKVLEGGTWATGRQLAFERSAEGNPPISIVSDGTVF